MTTEAGDRREKKKWWRDQVKVVLKFIRQKNILKKPQQQQNPNTLSLARVKNEMHILLNFMAF